MFVYVYRVCGLRTMLGSVHSLGRQGIGCVGVRAGRSEGEVVCSLTNGSIETYNVHDHCCVRSWSLQSSDHITCPCVYHAPSKQYCTIRNENEFLCWLEDAGSVEGSALTLPSNAHTLLPSPSLPHVAVVCSNGSVCLVMAGGALSLMEGGAVSLVGRVTRRTGKPQLRGATLLCCGGVEWVVVVYSRAGQSCVGTCAVRGEGLGSPRTSRLQLEGELVSWCVCRENLIALWSTGTLTSTALLPLLSLNEDPPLSLISHCHTSLPSPLTTVLLASVSNDYFAVWDSGMLSLCDARYATCQARTASHTTTPVQLACVDGSLYAVGGEGVKVCRVQCEGGGVLASALGRSTGPSTSPLLITPSWVEPNMDCGEWESETESRNKEEREVVSSLLDSSKTPSLDSFTAVFSSLHLSPGLWCGEVVRRVLNEERFWARKPLTQLLEAHLCPPSLSGELLSTASERNDWCLVAAALRCVEGVPELVLVGLLRQALSLTEVIECYGSAVQRDQLLYLLLSHPRNDTMIQQPFSQMPFPLVMSLLQFLSSQVAMEALLAPSPPLLPYNAVLDWTGLLLDVHFTQLAMVPEARQLLTSLHSRVSKQVLFLTHLSPLQGLAQTPPTLPQQHWLYRVEKLDISV